MTINITTVAIAIALVFVSGYLSHLALFLAQRALSRVPADVKIYIANYTALIKNKSLVTTNE